MTRDLDNSPLTIAERAQMVFDLLLLADPAEQVEALQTAQRLIQAELARRWQIGASPGHTYQPPQGDTP